MWPATPGKSIAGMPLLTGMCAAGAPFMAIQVRIRSAVHSKGSNKSVGILPDPMKGSGKDYYFWGYKVKGGEKG